MAMDVTIAERVVPQAEVQRQPLTSIEAALGRVPSAWRSVLVVSVAVVLAWQFRFVQDDAFISFRYAKNLVDGNGLVFNPGQPVEGYTNFLWTVLMAVPIALGLDPVVFSQVAGILAMVGTVLVTERLGTQVLRSSVRGTVVAIALVLQFSFLAYGTGGLETQLQSFLVSSAVLALVPWLGMPGRDGAAAARAGGASALIAMALLTRLDSAVLLVVPGVVAAVVLVRRRAVAHLAALVVPAAVILGAWFAWKVAYYGAAVPNTLEAKSMGPTSVLVGAAFLFVFVWYSLYTVFLPALVRRARDLVGIPGMWPVVGALLVWVVYLLYVGADFMEFRFMVPAMPFIAVVLIGIIYCCRSVAARWILVSALMLGLPFHAALFEGQINVDSTRTLEQWVVGPTGWVAMGRRLARDVATVAGSADDPPVIAVSAAGAIPYESDLPTVDMLGLNDPVTAREGLAIPVQTLPKPGHIRMATVEHLRSEGVNLVIGHPMASDPSDGPYDLASLVETMFLRAGIDVSNLEGVTVVEVPLADGKVLPMLYLKPSRVVDRLVEDRVWRQVPTG